MTKPDDQKPAARPIALETRETADDARLFSPSAGRNRDVIRDAFLAHMPKSGRVLEVGSGTGEHAAHIVAACPDLHWTPSDPDAASRASIAAHARAENLPNIAAPLELFTTDSDWGVEGPFDALVSINMIHIAPWAAAEGLLAGAGALLRPRGRLFLYGPFRRGGEHTAPSNAQFDENLRMRDPAWGVRDLDDEIAPLAEAHGLALVTIVEMPANNLSVVFEKA